MAKRLTEEEWVELARQKWGATYDYSRVRYKNSKAKVTVICRAHGEWQVMPVNHISGERGCPKCGIEALRRKFTKPFNKFLEEARALHGDRYAYDESSYCGARMPLLITCSLHGIFRQSPSVHLRPSNCPRCASSERLNESRNTSVNSIKKLILEASDGLVTIVDSSFTSINSKAEFLCITHGRYRRLVNTAINSRHPCLQCANERRDKKTVDINPIHLAIRAKFGDGVRYEIVAGRNLRNTHIDFSCAKHGEFRLSYSSLPNSPGCPACSRLGSQASRTEGLKDQIATTLPLRAKRWVERVRERHSDKFSYDESVYVDAKTPVVIICPVHGRFQQMPDSHLNSGCRACADEELLGRYSEKYFTDNPGASHRLTTLYYIRFEFEKEFFFKVGITTTSIRSRFSMASANGVSVMVQRSVVLNLLEAFRAEQEIQRVHGDRFRYRPVLGGESLRRLRIGPSECFYQELPLKLIETYFN